MRHLKLREIEIEENRMFKTVNLLDGVFSQNKKRLNKGT
jgi:hypothetical protein